MSAVDAGHKDWLDRLRGLAKSLGSNHRSTEQAFFALGERLHEAADTARSLNITAQGLAGRLSEPEFQQTLLGLDDALSLVERLLQAKGHRSGSLSGIAAAAAAIQHGLTSLERTISYVRMLGVNARIEVSQFAGDGTSMDVFSHEIVRLAGYAKQTIEKVGADLDRLALAANSAAKVQQEFESRNIEELTAIGERLSVSVSAMRLREHQAAHALSRLPGILTEAHDRIGGIVSSLQIGDSARQRSEHVDAALSFLINVVSGAKALPASSDADRQMRLCVNSVSDLQARQLAHIASDVEAEVADIRHGFEALSDGIAIIDSETSSVFSVGTSGQENFLMKVDHDLEAVAKVVSRYVEAIEATAGAMAEVNAAAGAMVESMEAIAEIDAEMNVIGLNASFKCGVLGERGRALNVVALELRVSARLTGQLSRDVSGKLRELLAAAEQLSADSGNGPVELAGLKSSLDSSVEILRLASSETTSVLERIRHSSHSVVNSVADALAGFDVDDRYSALAQEGGELLNALAAETRFDQPAAQLEQEREALLRLMGVSYTMDSERELHRQVVTGSRAQPFKRAAPPPKVVDESLDDIFF
jgi:di/tripeptidase